MSFESIPELLTMLLQEQRNTNEQICRLAEVLAGVRSATVDTAEAITKAKAPRAADEAPIVQSSDAALVLVPPTYQQTAAAVTKLAQTKSRDAALAVLQTFGVDKLPLLDPKHFSAVITAANKALEA